MSCQDVSIKLEAMEVEPSVGLIRNRSVQLDKMASEGEEDLPDVIVQEGNVIVSQGDIVTHQIVSNSMEDSLLINDLGGVDPLVKETKREKLTSPLRTCKRAQITESWRKAATEQVLYVLCKKISGELEKAKFGSGCQGRCIRVGKLYFTPMEFESHCGRSASKDWKRSIRFRGYPVQVLIDEGFIQVHHQTCSCAVCLDDHMAAGPVKLFQAKKRRKRQRMSLEDTSNKILKNCTATEPFNSTSSPTITLAVPELGQLSTAVTNVTLNASEVSPVLDLRIDKAWKYIDQALIDVESQSIKVRSMLTMMQERTVRELDEQRRILLRQKDDAISQAKLEAHLALDGRSPSENLFVEVREAESEEPVRPQRETPPPIMIETIGSSMPVLCASSDLASHGGKCVNCNRECSFVCSTCRGSSYCSAFCQRRDWSQHRKECSSNSTSQNRDAVPYIFMLAD